MLKEKRLPAKALQILVIWLLFWGNIVMAGAGLPAAELQRGKTLLLQGKKYNLGLRSDSAFLAYSKAAAIFKDHSPSGYMLARIGVARALLQMNATFVCYQQMQENEAYLQKHPQLSGEAYQRFYRLKGEMHFSNREVEKALTAWYQARRYTIKEYGKFSMETARAYIDLGKCYFAGGRTDSSFMYATRALEILNRQPDPLKTENAPIIYSLYGSHFRIMQYGKKEINNVAVVHKGKKYMTNAHINLAYQDSALLSEKLLRGAQSGFIPKIYTNIVYANAELYNALPDPDLQKKLSDETIALMNKSIKLYEKYHNLDRGFTHAYLAACYVSAREPDEKRGFEEYLKALKVCLPEYKGKTLYDLPEIKNVASENHLGIALEYICYAFLAKYQKSQDLKDLETFYQYALKSLELAEYIRNKKDIYATVGGAPSILFQNWNYGLSIEAAHMLYKKTGNEKYKQEAFRNIERFKNMNLLQSALNLRLANTRKSYDKYDSRLKLLTAKILRNEEKKQIVRNFTLLKNDPFFKGTEQRLDQARQEMKALETETRTQFPEFYEAKINRKYTLGLEDVKKQLPDDKTAVIGYFVNVNYDYNREAYIFVVQKAKTDFIRIDLPYEYEAQVDTLVQSITNSNLPVYRRLAGQFHDLLIGPARKTLGKQVKKLMIMPDGDLWKIPFETLLSSKTAIADYRKLPYLLHQYHISYQHSATLNKLGKEHAALQEKQFNEPILAMAPFADKNMAGEITSGKINLMGGETTDGKYANLPYTINLLLKLQQKIKGMFLIGIDATEDAFKANAGRYSIIHLATHAETDMANPLNSKFLMTKSKKEDGELYMSELLALNIKPNLAVLSACETGKGMIDTKSEGMTSLSWCFYYLGCPSTLSTLWKVDDRYTSNVLEGFYNYLFEGRTKQEALQLAKLDLLTKARTSEEANPFYWSGLVLTGDTGVLPFGQQPFWQKTWFGFAAGGLVIAVFGFWLWSRQQEKAANRKVFT